MKHRHKEGWLGMQNIREMLRLKEQQKEMNFTQIGLSVNAYRGTVRDYLSVAAALGIDYAKANAMSEEALRAAFEKKRAGRKIKDPEIDFNYIARELTKKGVTIHLLWEEHLKKHPNSYQYSQFAALFREWQGKGNITIRREYKAGEWMFCDYSGTGLEWVERSTGEAHSVQIFVAVLGASNLTYVEATPTQTVTDWIGSHVRALEYFGGVPLKVCPDNLKSGVTSACYYEPILNRTYAEWASHYQVAVIPARAKKPKDKAKVEGGVLIAQRWILAALRDKTFFSLQEINAAIKPLLEALNNKKMQEYGCSRRELFDSTEREALQPLPQFKFEISTWKKAKVHIDYHVEYKSHYYSVPYRHIGKYVELRIRENTLDVFLEGVLAATHLRSSKKGFHTTVKDHMPPAHQFVSKDLWTPDKLLNWAAKIGPQTKTQLHLLMNSRQHPEQGFRACLGILRLEKIYSAPRLEVACGVANKFGCVSYRYLHDMLRKNLEKLQHTESPPQTLPLIHSNIRGSQDFH
jgi:transposase